MLSNCNKREFLVHARFHSLLCTYLDHMIRLYGTIQSLIGQALIADCRNIMYTCGYMHALSGI